MKVLDKPECDHVDLAAIGAHIRALKRNRIYVFCLKTIQCWYEYASDDSLKTLDTFGYLVYSKIYTKKQIYESLDPIGHRSCKILTKEPKHIFFYNFA